MKSWGKAVIGIASFASVAIGGAWYVMSGNIVASVKQAIDLINSTTTPTLTKVTVSYGSLTRTAFPTIGAQITDATVKVELPMQRTGVAAVVQWTTKGSSTWIAEPLHNQYRLRSNAATDTRLSVGDKTLVMHVAATPIELMVRAMSHKAYTALATPNLQDGAAKRALMGEIAQATMNIGPMRLTNENGELLYSHDAFGVSFAHTPDPQFHDVNLALVMKDSQTTPAYQTYVRAVMEMLGTPALPFNPSSIPFTGARAGKQNADIAAHLRLPRSAGLMVPDGTAIVFTRFDISNDFFHLKLPFSLTQQHVGANRILQANIDGEYSLSETGSTEVTSYAVPLVARVAGLLHAGAEGTSTEAAITDTVTAAIPTVSSLGPVTLALDLEANLGQKPNQPDASPPSASTASGQDQYTLNRFTLNHAHWGLDAKGMFINPNDGKSGVVSDITIHCLKCSALIADAFTKARAVQTAANLLSPDHQLAWRVDEAVEKQIDAFIGDIGKKDATTGDVTLAITTPSPGNIQFNGKSIAEVGPKLMAIIAPEMAAKMSASGVSAPADAPAK